MLRRGTEQCKEWYARYRQVTRLTRSGWGGAFGRGTRDAISGTGSGSTWTGSAFRSGAPLWPRRPRWVPRFFNATASARRLPTLAKGASPADVPCSHFSLPVFPGSPRARKSVNVAIPCPALESKALACEEAVDRLVSTVIAALVPHRDRADQATLGAEGDQKAGDDRPGGPQPGFGYPARGKPGKRTTLSIVDRWLSHASPRTRTMQRMVRALPAGDTLDALGVGEALPAGEPEELSREPRLSKPEAPL